MLISFIDLVNIIFLGIIEGITEWLPISSTGHMLLIDQFIYFNVSEEFKEMFFVVIQLGAIMAVVILFWKNMNPVQYNSSHKLVINMQIISMWIKTAVACIPGALVTILFDDFIETNLHTPLIIASMLIIYGIAFIVIERLNRKRIPVIKSLDDIDYKTALIIGLFQVLSIIPGTSRSGATIVGALIIGVSRIAAAEFTFFLAVPVMFGLSTLKIVKFGFAFSKSEIIVLLIGMFVAFIVSVFVIKFLMDYIKKHDFEVFGKYRIGLGILVILYFI